MDRRRVCLALVIVVLFLSPVCSPVSSHWIDVDMTLSQDESYEVHNTLTNGSRIVGNFSFPYALGEIYFFICNGL